MIENGSDMHQGGYGPLMRATLKGDCIPMMGPLVVYGADVTASGTEIPRSSLRLARQRIWRGLNGSRIDPNCGSARGGDTHCIM